MAATAVLAAVPAIGAQPAHSQPYPPNPPELTLSATTVSAGEDLDFTGTGFAPNEGVNAFLYSKPFQIGHFTANANGTVKGTVTIPRWTEPGWHVFRLKGQKSKRALQAVIKVRSYKPQLSNTGDKNSFTLLGGTAALLALGGGTMVTVRRRQRG
ncbi:LPXTG cell wall anchor domain-containing protein [Streptomyces sp. NPDC006265]|uniref:LPXTG cell wall anchor domain-containing protein n=1 Tax=Streptomyces sp. NPDC006265 TaxID=3156740 RepID=UPI0033B18FAE